MVKLALTLILGLTFVSSVSAQESKRFHVSQPCEIANKIFATVDSYGETPLFVGTGIQFGAENNTPFRGGAMFFVNQDTGTWSLISLYSDGMACMVSVGTDFEPYSETSSGGAGEKG